MTPKLFTTEAEKHFMDSMYESITHFATKADESIDSAGVHLERWLYQDADYIVVRTDKKVHTIYNQALNNMYTAK
jgi:hypothetical protein